MKELEYIPQVCKEREELQAGKLTVLQPTFEGRVLVKPPKYSDYLRLMSKLSISKEQNHSEQMSMMADVADELPKYIKEVKLVRLKDKKEFNQLPDLECDPECYPIISELCGQLIAGFKIEGEAKPS